MESNQKWVSLSFLTASILIAFVSFLFASRILGALDFEGRIQDLDMYLKSSSLALGVLSYVFFYKSATCQNYVGEVLSELSKVTWPGREETFKGTIAVLIAVTVAGFLLWIVDGVWGYLLRLVM